MTIMFDLLSLTSFVVLKVMANKHPQLLEKIILASFLAPVAYVDHMKSPIRIFAPYASSLEVIFVKSQPDIFEKKLVNVEQPK